LVTTARDDSAALFDDAAQAIDVLLSRADYDALTETAWLLRAPANATRLLESLAQAHAGQRSVHDLDR
jgi:antitoxin YefM